MFCIPCYLYSIADIPASTVYTLKPAQTSYHQLTDSNFFARILYRDVYKATVVCIGYITTIF